MNLSQLYSRELLQEQFLPIPVNFNNADGNKPTDFIFEPGQKEISNYILPNI